MESLSSSFWANRYQTGSTGWDMGQVSPPIKAYADQLDRKDLRILIPGAGNSYEAEYLHQQGFGQVFVLDIVQQPLDNLRKRVPDFPVEHLLQHDFFELKGSFDLILEQTFFCALPPALRADYARKMAELLGKGGKLSGLMFDFPLTEQGPPFGGSKEEYLNYFEPYFEVKTLERCYNSVEARQGKELFVQLLR